jgi:serine/threonine-protein kinase
MAPEQIRGNPPVSHKTDLYALGVVLYQLLVGKPPFEGSTPVVLMHSHLNENPPRPSARVHEIPKVLDELVVNLMAKSPTDRPWDAAAVQLKLTELREKVNAGASIAMVWPTNAKSGRRARKGASGFAGDSAIAGEATGTTARKKKSRKSRSPSGVYGKDGTEGDGASFWLNRTVLETALLVGALLGIGAFITYKLWPPSAADLYAQAEALMASKRGRPDWTTARDEYMKELDERFPNHPYQPKLREWRDKILLVEAEARASNLKTGLDMIFTRPANDSERKFVVTHGVADAAEKRFDELAATAQWQEMADQLKEAAKPSYPVDPEERQWYLLALHRVEELKNRIKDRRETVEKLIAQSDAAFRGGRPNEGLTIRSNLVEQFGKFTDLVDIFQSPAFASDANSKDATPGPPSASPPGESGKAPAPKTAAEGKDSGALEEPKDEAEKAPTGGTSPRDSSSSSSPDEPLPQR